MKFFGSSKILIHKIKNSENLPSLDVVEVAGNQYQQKTEILYLFMPSTFYACLLNLESSNLEILKTYNTEFNETIITFKDKNGRSLEIEDKVNLKLLINK